MPARLTPAQTENAARMRTMPREELRALLRDGGVPASVANTRFWYSTADLVRIAIVYDINVPTLPPSLAPTSGGGGGGGGQTGSGASSGDGDDDGSNSNTTMIGVVIAVTVVLIVVVIAAAL